MSSAVGAQSEAACRTNTGARVFAFLFVTLAVSSCALAGLVPLGFSIVTVFLFAGPHNWMEARFFLSRMPAGWGRLKHYFVPAFAGVLALFGTSLLLPSVARNWQWRQGEWLMGIAGWNTLLVLWVVFLAERRYRETGGSGWLWVAPAGFALIAANWLWPLAWSLALVYLHPLVALWYLDRELGRRRKQWRLAYRLCLAAVPALLFALWWQLANAPPLPGNDLLSMQITHHAGANILSGISSRLLVATHVFLEMLHYAAWIVVIPLVGYAGSPWSLKKVPLANRSGRWKLVIAAVLIAGAAATLFLWAGFLADYPLTRDAYFSVAILHVLAEIPFLLRLL